MADTKPWCIPTDTSDLHETALKFLQALDLPSVHPRCDDGFDVTEDSFTTLAPSTPESLMTLYYQIVPPLLAMGELWLRLFAFLVAPMCISYSLRAEISYRSKSDLIPEQKWTLHSSILGMASSAILLTDSLYVMEYGRSYGALMFTASTLLSLRCCLRRKKAFWLGWLPILLITVFAFLDGRCDLSFLDSFLSGSEMRSDNGSTVGPYAVPKEGGFGRDLPPAMRPGLYYSQSNPRMANIAKEWPEERRAYDGPEGAATPYLVTGDSRTGIPFIVNRHTTVRYYRVWVPSEVDEESVALDVAFPPSKGHDEEKPFYLILHGLSGGSQEEYLKEFIRCRTDEGSTVAVMVARGLMDTPVYGHNLFHGARVTDADVTAKRIKRALSANQTLAGVGYSMGAIILSNYVARSGKDCHLDVAVSISGGLDMRYQLVNYRSIKLWQPILAKELKNIFLGKFLNKFQKRLTAKDVTAFFQATSVSSIDKYAIVRYNGFESVQHYYSEMSAMGDTTSTDNVNGRFTNISIPLLVIHALDDPLIHWKTLGTSNPDELVKSGSGFLMLLLTKSGGHVGWPLGMNPRTLGWRWMNDAVKDFVEPHP